MNSNKSTTNNNWTYFNMRSQSNVTFTKNISKK